MWTPENRKFTVTMICVTAIVVAVIVAVVFMNAAGMSDKGQRQAIGVGILLAFVGNALNQIWARSASSKENADTQQFISREVRKLVGETHQLPPDFDERCRNTVRKTLEELGIITPDKGDHTDLHGPNDERT